MDFLDKIKKVIKYSDRPIIIFPQATRVDFNDRTPFKKGVARIYKEVNIKCQPVAINSGKVWPKSGNLIPKQILTVSILEEINIGIDENDFLKNLQDKIYNELDNLS